MIRLAAFDYDGTLVATEEVSIRQTMDRLTRAGITFTKEDLAALSGANGLIRSKIMDECFMDQEAYRSCRDSVVSYRSFAMPPLAEIASPHRYELMSFLHQHGVAIVIGTNSASQRVAEGLKEIGLGEFSIPIYSGYELGHSKPDPFIFKKAMKDYGVSRFETVVIEDSKMGIRAGKESGARIIALKDAMGISDQREADIIVDDLKDVIGIIQKWGVQS